MSDGTVPFGGHFLDNDDPHNFSKLAREWLDAANFANIGFKGYPMWPTYFLVFQSLENFLKAYLLSRKATPAHVKKKIGHNICNALAEAKIKGLSVNVPKDLEDAVMEMSKDYQDRDFQYRSIGTWTKHLLPSDVIEYVEAVSKVASY